MTRQAILYTLVLLVIFGCTPKDEARDAGLNLATAESATTCNCQSCLYTGATMTQGKLSCCVGLLAAISCATQPPKPPVPDAGTGGSYSTGGTSSVGGGRATGGTAATGGTSGVQSQEQLACANELRLGCPEGSATNCAGIMATRCANPKVKCNTACIVNATSKATLQTKCLVACGAL